jgi:hypothetical protein
MDWDVLEKELDEALKHEGGVYGPGTPELRKLLKGMKLFLKGVRNLDETSTLRELI